jgi:hypothetical protein
MFRLAATGVAFFLALSSAAAAPAGLLDKAIRVSYSASAPFAGSNGRARLGWRSFELTLYISGAGRIFERRVGTGKKGQEERENEPAITQSTFRFLGSQLVRTAGSDKSASQVTISFDSNFQSCTVDVVIAGPEGGTRAWTSLNGEKRIALGPATVSGQSCSVQSGNPFAK